MNFRLSALFLTHFLFLVSLSTLIAQDNFRPGYIIKANGDSLVGDIAFEEEVKNPNTVSFREGNNGGTKNYSPLEIREFRAGDDWYIGGTFDIETSSITAPRLSKTSDFEIEQRDVFLRVLFLGEKSLYHLYGPLEKDFFYTDKDGKITLLLTKKYLRKKNIQGTESSAERGNDHIVINNQYWGQLSVYLQNCAGIPERNVAVKYKKSALIKLFDQYYKCTGESLIYKDKSKNNVLFFGLVGGATLTQIDLKGTSIDDAFVIDHNFNSSTDIFLGISLEFAIVQKKLTLYNELVYTSFKTSGYEEIPNQFDQPVQNTIELGSSYIKLNNLLRYYITTNGIGLYVNAGISTGFQFNKTNYHKRVLVLPGENYVTEKEAIPGEVNLESGILGGIGGKLNKISFEVRYERSNGLMGYSNDATLKSSANRFNVIVGFQL